MNPIRPLATSARLIAGLTATLAAALLAVPSSRAQSTYPTPYTFATLAGTPPILTGPDGTGSASQFLDPYATAVDMNGNVYVLDLDAIRKISPGGVVTTLAGTEGVSGSANGTGSAASFNNPIGLAVDGNGNLYVADQGNQVIRKVTPAGVVTTFAGTLGVGGSSDGTGTAASFSLPAGVAVDGNGNVYVADNGNNSIRKITPAGVVTTIAGTPGVAGSTDGTGTAARFNSPIGIAVDTNGNIFVADQLNCTVRMITPAGVVTTLAGLLKAAKEQDGTGTSAAFAYPAGVAVDANDNIYVSDEVGYTIRKVTLSGVVTTIAGKANVEGFGDGQGTASRFYYPFEMSTDSAGNVYIADLGNYTVRKMTPSAAVSTLAGTPGDAGFNDGTGSAARMNFPASVALDSGGNLYVADANNDTIRKVTPGGTVTTIAGSPGAAGSADGTGSAAQFYSPYGTAVDSSGNIYVTDQLNQTIRKITPGGVVTTLAGTPGMPGSANGTGSAALFYYPSGIAIDSSGNLYVGEERNFDIRKITPAGVVTTLAGTAGTSGSSDGTGPAAQFELPAGLAIDGSGNVYVADYGNATIRKITPSGVVTTIAGSPGSEGSSDGTGSSARFWDPSGIAVDGSGNLYVAEQKNDTIRKITPAGVVTTLAGKTATAGATDGTGSSALFNGPFGISVDGAGYLYVADAGNNEIRKGSASGAPQISVPPSNDYVAPGGTATFSVTATGSSTLSYQWNLNGTPIPGATSATYTITNAQAANAGSYTVTVTDADGSTTSSAGSLYVNSGNTGARLINISTRAQVGTGGSILIPGFVIGGSGTETLLIRGDGPGLTQFGLAGVLAQPILSVYNSSNVLVASNTGWGTNTTTSPSQIASIAAQVGAFALPAGSADCAVVANLPPGSYTVQIAGVGNTTGIALAEVYEVSSSGTTRLINISTRAQVGTGGGILIPGFVVSGTGTEELLVRADGPALSQFGLSGVLATPSLSLYNSSNVLVASNTGWGTSTSPSPSEIASIAQEVGAFALTSNSADCAQVVFLQPGAYTMQVSGVGSTTGVALAEVYEVQ